MQTLKWSGKKAPPMIGDTVKVRINKLGTAKVTGYFEDEGYLGVTCILDNPPAWHLKQNGGPCTSHLFGAELE